MIVALTARQWQSLVRVTGLGEPFETIGKLMGVDLDEEGGRFAARELIGATLRPWVLARTLPELQRLFDDAGVLKLSRLVEAIRPAQRAWPEPA